MNIVKLIMIGIFFVLLLGGSPKASALALDRPCKPIEAVFARGSQMRLKEMITISSLEIN